MMKKNYLLIMPRVVKKFGEGYVFPLGISYISSNMKREEFNVHNLNLNHIDGEWEKILLEMIELHCIDVIALGGQSFQFNSVKEVVGIVKSCCPKILVIVGGGIITADPIPAMEALEDVDYGIIGEGEITMNQLCTALENDFLNIDKCDINGIIFKQGEGYCLTKSRKEINDLSEIAWPDYDGFGYKQYVENIVPTMISSNQKNSLFMLTSRSCPYNCTFCFHTVGKTYRQRPLDDIFDELEYMTTKYHIQFIYFVDELFGYNIERLREFCHRIKKYNIKWWSQFRVNDITAEKLEMLKDAHCTIMTFGLESADNRVLKSMRKAITIEQTESTLKMVYDAGIAIDGCFIFGDAAETYETSMNTLSWWDKHVEYNIGLGFITVYPGSYLYHYAVNQGIIKNKVDFLNEGCPQVNVSKMNNDEFSKIMDEITIRNMCSKKIPKDLKIYQADYFIGEIGVMGLCDTCGHRNKWNEVILFRHTPLVCSKCGQRYDMPLLEEMLLVAETNIRKLVEGDNIIAIWGINDKVTELILKSTYLKKLKQLYFVDISTIK